MSKWLRYVVAGLLLAVFSASAYSQTVEDTLSVYFHKSSAVFNKKYRNNEARAEEFFRVFNAFQSVSDIKVLKVETIGVASPEGQSSFNEILSKARMAALRRIIKSKSSYPDSLIFYSNLREDWGELAEAIANDSNVVF